MAPEIQFLKFQNPTRGEIVFGKVISEIQDFMKASPRSGYKIMIGSDSNGNNAANGGTLDVVSVIAIHRVGNGGKYFWSRSARRDIHTLRQKIYAEVDASLQLAALFLPAFKQALRIQERKEENVFDFQIHVDVGMYGETRDLIREVTGVVRGYGYDVFVKPDSAAATSLADRHVR
jgi:predicted RNase H-related nuclease YkuK (DUF458 family)